MERVPSAEQVSSLVAPLSSLAVRDPSEPALPAAPSGPAIAQVLNIGAALSGPSTSGLAAALSSDRGASHAPPPTPATLPDSPLLCVPSPALRGRADELAILDGMLAGVQLRLTNDAMLRGLLPSLRREPVEAALTRFAKVRAETGRDGVNVEGGLAEEVRRLQDGVTTGYIARAREGDVGAREREVPEDLRQRMDDLEDESRRARENAVQSADFQLENMAKLVGEQGDPHNVADLAIAKHVQATMQTLKIVRDEHVAQEKARVTAVQEMATVRTSAVAVAPSTSPAPYGAQYTAPARQQQRQHQNGAAPAVSAVAQQSAAVGAYYPGYPAAVVDERPLKDNGYEPRAQVPVSGLYPVRDVVQVSAPYATQDRRQEQAVPATGLYSQPGPMTSAGAYPAPSSFSELASYPALSSQLAPTSYPTPTSYALPAPPQHGPPPRDDTAERLAARRSYPVPTSYPIPSLPQHGLPLRDDTAERLASRASYPRQTSHQQPQRLSQRDDAAERITSGVHAPQGAGVNVPQYPGLIASEPGLSARADARVGNPAIQYRPPPHDVLYPGDQQHGGVPPPQKPCYSRACAEAQPEYSNMASQARPQYSNMASHGQPPYSTATLNVPESYGATASNGEYQHSDERHRPLHTSDPPGFQSQEAGASYSHMPQPPSPDVRTPPPEYASGRPHSLSNRDYLYAQSAPEHPSASTVYPPGRRHEPLSPQYPSGVFTTTTVGPEPPRYHRNPDVYQPPHPEELCARPLYPNGRTSPGHQPYYSPNLYPGATSQDSQPSLHSRHSTPAYATGYSAASQQQYSLQPYPQPIRTSESQRNPINPYGASPGYGVNQYLDPALPRRAASHIGAGYYGSRPAHYGANGPNSTGPIYGREQQSQYPQMANQSQNHPVLPATQSVPSHGQPSYPQRRTSYIDNNLRVPGAPQQHGYSLSGSSQRTDLQEMANRQHIQTNAQMGNAMYNTGMSQPPIYGPLNRGMAQPPVPGLLQQGPNMMGLPAVGGIPGVPAVPGISGMGVMGPPGGIPQVANQGPHGAGQMGAYPHVGPVMAHRVPDPTIPGSNPNSLPSPWT